MAIMMPYERPHAAKWNGADNTCLVAYVANIQARGNAFKGKVIDDVQ